MPAGLISKAHLITFRGVSAVTLWTLQKSCFISCLLKIFGKKNRPFEGKHELVLAHCQIATSYGKRMGEKKTTHTTVLSLSNAVTFHTFLNRTTLRAASGLLISLCSHCQYSLQAMPQKHLVSESLITIMFHESLQELGLPPGIYRT